MPSLFISYFYIRTVVINTHSRKGERKSKMRKQWITVTTIVFTILAASSLAGAATIVWNDGVGAPHNWSVGGNWVGAAAPGAGDIADFDGTDLDSVVVDANTTVQGIDFGSGAAYSITGAFTLTIGTAIGIDTTDANDYGISAPVTLGIAQQWDIIDNSTLTVTGAVGGNFGIIKAGNGTLALNSLSGNTFTGGVNLTDGTISLAHTGGMGGGAVTASDGTSLGASVDLGTVTNDIAIAGGGTLTIDGPGNMGFSGVISGAASNLTIDTTTNGEIITLYTAAGYTGDTRITQGILQLGNSDVIDDASDLIVDTNGTFNLGGRSETVATLTGAGTGGAVLLNAGGALTVSTGTYDGAITGTGSLTKQNAGTLTLTGANAYTGGTIVTGGTLVGDDSGLQGDIANSAAVQFTGAGTYDGALTGTGTFEKVGAGTLTLSTANGYTGITTLTTGGLRLGNVGSIGTNTLNAAAGTFLGASTDLNTVANAIVIAGGVLTIDGPNNMTLGGDISGGGGLTITTDTALAVDVITLSGTNTYGGATTITQGTLIASGTAAIPNGSAVNLTGAANARFELADGGANDETIATLDGVANSIVDLNTSTLTTGGASAFAGVIMDNGGAGALTKTGAGVLTLSGASTYGGLTTILGGGTISIGAANNIGGAGGIEFGAGGGTLDVTATSFTLPDAVTLTGAGTINNAGGLTTTLGGAITGGGMLTKTGAGILRLTNAANAYTGDTTVTGGTLEGQGGPTGGAPLQGDIINNATVNFIQAANADYNGVMTGAGLVNKTGAARLIISNNGSGAFTGTVDVTAGTLWLNGTLGNLALAGDMRVLAGATLGGTDLGAATGFYGGNLLVAATGIVAPGNSIGTLNIGGNYTPAAGSFLDVEVTLPGTAPQDADLLDVDGNVILGGIPGNGTVRITLVNEITELPDPLIIHRMPSAANTYMIVQSAGGAGVTGEFAGLTPPAVNTAIFQHSLAYPGAPGGPQVNYVLNRNTIQSLALTKNQTAVGTALEARIRDAGDMLNNVAPIINGYPLAAQVRTALNQISPASLDVTTGATLDNSRRFFDGLAEHLHRHHVPGPNETTTTARADDDDMPLLAFGGNNDDVLALMMEAREQKRADRAEVTDGPLRLWVRQFNNWSDEDAENDIPGYDNFTTGVVLGGDVKVGDNLAVGVAVGYSNTDIDLTGGFGTGEIDSLRGSIYATWFKDGVYADAALGFGNNWYDNTRNLAFIGRRANSDHEGQEWNAYLGGGYDFLFFGGYVGPTVSVQYTGLHEEAYDESGAAALNQNIDARDSHSLQTAVGMRFLYPIKLPDEKTTLVPEFRAKWLHEFMNDRDVSARFTGGGATYTVDGNSVEDDSVLLGGRLSAYLNENLSLYADYELQLQGSGGQTGHTVSAGVRIAW